MKSLWITTIFLFAGMVCSAKQDGMATAERLMNAGRPADAFRIYMRVLGEEPNNVYALEGAAVIQSRYFGNFLEAAKLFDRAAGLKDDNSLLYNSGLSNLQGGKVVAAVKSFLSCTEDTPGSRKQVTRQCHIKLAQCFRDLERFDDVQKHLIEAIKLDPQQADAYSYLADTYNNLKQFSLAISVYDDAIKIKPTDPTLWTAKGDAYTNMKNQVDALECYKKGRLLAPPASRVALEALIGQYFCSMETGNWRAWEEESVSLMETSKVSAQMHIAGQGPPSPLSPYRMLFFQNSGLSLLIAIGWSSSLVREGLKAAEIPAAYVDHFRRESTSCDIRIGYLSRRFEDYPGTQMMLRLFGSHNRSRVCVHSFAHVS